MLSQDFYPEYHCKLVANDKAKWKRRNWIPGLFAVQSRSAGEENDKSKISNRTLESLASLKSIARYARSEQCPNWWGCTVVLLNLCWISFFIFFYLFFPHQDEKFNLMKFTEFCILIHTFTCLLNCSLYLVSQQGIWLLRPCLQFSVKSFV